MNTLNDTDAKELVDGFDSLPDADKPRAASLLRTYSEKKAEMGLKPFQAAQGVSRDRRERFEALYAKPDDLAGGLPEGDRQAFQQAAGMSLDGEEAKRRAVNQAWVFETYPQLANPAMVENWPAVRRGLAKEFFGVDKPEVPESELFGLIGQRLAKEKGEREMRDGMLEKVWLAASKGNVTFAQAWKEAASGISSDPNWEPTKHDAYRREAQMEFKAAQDKTLAIRPVIDAGKAYFEAELSKEGRGTGEYAKEESARKRISEARTAFVQGLMQLSPEQRELALGLAVKASADLAPQEMGAEGGAGFADKAAAKLERGMAGVGGNIVRIAKQTGGTVAGHWMFPGVNADTDYERREIERAIDEGLADAVDPVKSKSRIVQGIYDAVESLPYMGLAVVPYAGIPLTLAAMAEDNRQKFVANGVSKDAALGLAFLAAAPQVGIERLQANLIFKGKMPGFEKWLGKPVTTKIELAKKIAAVSGLSVATENVEEWLQDATPYVVQEVASMLTDSVPDANGTKEWNEVLAPWSKGRVDTFFALLPLALVGAGTATFKEASYGRAYLSDMKALRAVFSEEVANKIATAETVEQKEALVREEWGKRVEAAKVETEAAAADVGAMDAANAQAQADAFAELDESMKASYAEQSAGVGGASAVRQDDGSFVVLDREGNMVDVAFTAEAAVELMDEVNRADDLDMSQAIADMVDYFNGFNEAGQTIEVTGESRTLQDKVEAGEITEEEAQRAVDVAIAMGRLTQGSTPADAQIQGENVSLFNARTGLFEDVSRIYEGADPLVVVEERSEGYLKRRWQDGSLDEKTVQKWREQVEGGPQRDNSKRALIEWFSGYAKAYMVGEAQTDGIPASFRAFLRALKDYLGEVLGMAKKLREMQAKGEMQDFRQHLAQAVGLDRSWLEAKEREAERQATKADRSQYSAREALLELGLPKPKQSGGEMSNLWDSLNFGQRMRLFSGERSMDEVAELLRVDYGFSWVQGETEVRELAERVFLRGEEVFSDAVETEATFSLSAVGEVPSDPKAYMTITQSNSALRAQYVKDGKVVASSRFTPSGIENPPIGAWRIDSYKGLYGHEIEQLRRVPVADLLLSEEDWSDDKTPNVEGRGDDARRYADWLKEGRTPPPIEVVETDSGKLKVMNGHRRLGAHKRAGVETIVAWVSPSMDHPKGMKDSDGKVMRVGMTYEGMTGSEWQGAESTFALAPAVESEAFKKWFGQSKVVDAQGKPLVVYHGTNADFSVFSKERLGANKAKPAQIGFWFAESAEYAGFHGDAVMPVYLAIQKPYIVRDSDDLQTLGRNVERVTALKERGYDGVILAGKDEQFAGRTVRTPGIFAVFESTQIKSAIGNRGTFDGSNPDITFAITSKNRIEEMDRVLKERKVTNRINTGEHQGEAFSSVLQDAMAGVTYEVQGDEASKERVSAYLNDVGMERALTLFMSDLELNGSGKDWVVLGSSLVRALDKAGRYQDAQLAANRLAERGTSAGQTVQAFSLFGQTVDSLEKALVMFSRENRLKAEGIKRANPAIEASKEELKKLFTEDEIAKRVGAFINRLNGITLKTKQPVRVEDLPEVTFALSPAVRASGLLTTVAGMLRESDYFDVRKALVERYGDNVKPHLEEVLVEAQVLNQKRKARSKAQKSSQKRSDKAGDTKTPPKASVQSEAEVEAALDEAAQDAMKRREQVTFSELEGLVESFEVELERRLRERSIVVPSPVREANRSLLEQMRPSAEDFAKAFSKSYEKRFDVRKLTDAEVQRLGELAQNIRSTPENSQERLTAVVELNSFVLDRVEPYDAVDVTFALWYSGVLSGIPTTIRNVLGNTSFLLGTLAQFPLQQSPKDFLRSLASIGPAIQAASGVAGNQAKAALLKGRGESAFTGNEKGRKRVLETKKMWGPWKASKYVTRFLAAQDALFSSTAYELKSYQVALEMARSAVERGDINEEQLAAEIERLLNNTSEQIADFTARAEREWDGLTDELKGRNEREAWIKERVGELRMKERNAELVQRATRAAERATFNYAPEGILGMFLGALDAGFGQAERLSKDAASPSARRVGKVISKFGKAQVIPFFRVPVNVFNQALDYTPAGFARYVAYGHFGRWVTQGGMPKLEEVSADERAETLNKALIGLASMAVLMLTAWPDDDDPPALQIHGAGSGRPNIDTSKNGPRWQPWSLEVRTDAGSTFFSYKLLPFAPLLAGIGFVHDRARYKDTQDKDVGVFSFMQGMMASFLAQSPMQGLQELAETSTLDRLRKEESMRKVMGRAVVGFGTNAAIPLANFWRSIDRMTALDEKRQQDTAAAAMLAQVPFGEHANRPRVDLLGDSIENRPFDWLFTQMDAGTPEGRIYRILGEKNVTPADSYGWKSKMEPEQFYEFTRFRGQFLKDTLLRNDERLLKVLQKLPAEAAQEMMDDITRDATDYAKFKVGYIPKEKN